MKRWKAFYWLVCVALFASILPSASRVTAQAVGARQDPPPASDQAPPGYTPLQPLAAAAVTTGADVLLIRTALPWDSNADTEVLDSLGYTYQVADMSNLAGIDLFSYPVILIVNDQVQAFYDQYASQAAAFESYVKGGGTLVFFAASDGWAGGTLRSNLPGGVSVTTPWYQNYNYIAAPDHPIVSRILSEKVPTVDGDWYSNYCSHGYFSNLLPDTTVILKEQNGYPTLIEYKLGSGRVIASTQTWEHNWVYHTGQDLYGSFARKSLDDVFLYAFSSGGRANVKLVLRVDDAQSATTVNKSRGSYVDVVARVSGDQAYVVNAKLSVPGDVLGKPVATFTRPSPGSREYAKVNDFTNPAGGQYVIADTLSAPGKRYSREYVWRFEVGAGVKPQKGILLSASASVPDHITGDVKGNAKLDIVDRARSIIVTNRELLFEKYQPDLAKNDVMSLLEEVYSQAFANDGEVFYADYYDDGVRFWDQKVDYSSETKANTIAVKVDDLVNSWYARLTKTLPDGAKSRPEYLLIVGGDEIIPFYRTDDRNYYSEAEKKNSKPGCTKDTIFDMEFECVRGVNANDPIGAVPANHYFLSDNIYADVGGDLSQWQRGELELAVGRIIGATAADMQKLMISPSQTPTVDKAVMASRTADHNLTTVRAKLNAHKVALYGESDPDLTENDQWTKAQWLKALEQPFQVLAYQGHGAYSGWYGTNDWRSNGVSASEQPSGQIGENHPLFVVEACNFALPYSSSNIAAKLINLGAAGLVSSTAIDTTAGDNAIRYGEEIHNKYFAYWLKDGETSDSTGAALLKAKQNYGPSGVCLAYDPTDKKAQMEYVLYGVPWATMTIPKGDTVVAAQTPAGYHFTAQPAQGSGAYSKLIEVKVDQHSFTPQDGFELLTIPGSDTTYTSFEPVLPSLQIALNLPPGAVVTGVTLTSETAENLGQHTLPAADPITSFNASTGYTSTMSVHGLYPAGPRFGYRVTDFGDRQELRIAVAPATYNVDTHEVVLYTSTVLRVDYQAPGVFALSDLQISDPQVAPGETLDFHAACDNVGSSPAAGSATLRIYNKFGDKVSEAAPIALNVPAGAQQPLAVNLPVNLAPGSYQATLAVTQAGGATVTSVASFLVEGGRITNVAAPDFAQFGTFSPVELHFANLRNAPIDGTATIRIYDDAGLEVANLLQRSFSVDPTSEAALAWSWDPAGLPEGSYTLRATVTVYDEVYTSTPVYVAIGATPPPPSVAFKDAVFVVDESTGTAAVQLGLSKASASPITLHLATADGSAQANSDYVPAVQDVTVAPGTAEVALPVAILDDLLDEDDESLLVQLTGAENATLGAQSKTQVVIADNDLPPQVSFASPTYSVAETAGKSTISVLLGAPSGKTVRAAVSTQDGTGVAGRDYVPLALELVFAPGETQKSFDITVLDNRVNGATKTVLLRITSLNGATIGGQAVASLAITNVFRELHVYLPAMSR